MDSETVPASPTRADASIARPAAVASDETNARRRATRTGNGLRPGHWPALFRRALLPCALLIPTPHAYSADVYQFDKTHTQILFFVDHFGFSKSQGEFLDFEGTFSFDKDDFRKTKVDLTIFTDSIDMDDEEWNEKMRSKTYFDTSEHPTMHFVSTSVEPLDARNAIVNGHLTLLDATRPVVLSMVFNKTGLNLATGDRVAGFSGRASLLRSDFGMTKHLRFIGDEVEIRLEVEGYVEQRRRRDL